MKSKGWLSKLFRWPLFSFVLVALLLTACAIQEQMPSQKSMPDVYITSQEVSTDVTTPDVMTQKRSSDSSGQKKKSAIEASGHYTSKEDVALYIHTYKKLPQNYITKQKAQEKGWDSKAGNLDKVLPGMSIGGSAFGNYEGQLPKAKGRKYYECDIDYTGGYRNEKRLIYSNDGLVFYTQDHYKTFEQLY